MMTSERSILKNAPIYEALLDIRVKLPSDKTSVLIESLYEKIKLTFPGKQKKFSFSGQINFQFLEPKFKSQNEEPKLIGFVFHSEDKNRVIQATIDGFTYHLLKPYANWESFKMEARDMWNLYEEILQPVIRQRIALRFINKIKFPEGFDPNKYFQTIPTLGEKLKIYPLQNLFSQITIRNNKIGADANIIEGIEPTEEGEGKTFIFDIDTYCTGDFKTEEMWSKFDSLRDFKNEIFFESITKETLDIIK